MIMLNVAGKPVSLEIYSVKKEKVVLPAKPNRDIIAAAVDWLEGEDTALSYNTGLAMVLICGLFLLTKVCIWLLDI